MPKLYGNLQGHQGGLSLSTMNAKFVAALEIAREMLGLREMLSEIGNAQSVPMKLNVEK